MYTNLPKQTQKGQAGGYKDALWYSPVADFDVIARPIVNPAVLGDKVKVTTAHTWDVDKGAYKWDAKKMSVVLRAEPVGDPGSQELMHRAEVIILGDNPEIYQSVVQSMNDDAIVFIKDAECLENDTYIQLGDDCNPVEVVANFDSFNNSEGKKSWTLTISSKKKFFYNAALTEAV
jgi:hypothetical protein